MTGSGPATDNSGSTSDHGDYLESFAALYPFAMVDFTSQEGHDGEFVGVEAKDKWVGAVPEECDPCAELKDYNDWLVSYVKRLERHLAYHH